MTQLNSLGHQLKPPVPQIGYIFLSHLARGIHRQSHVIHKMLLPRLLITLHNLLKIQLIYILKHEKLGSVTN